MTIKRVVKKLIPKVLLFWYHYLLAFCGAVFYGFPSRRLAVIGVTGTSGKSTTVDFIARIFEEHGDAVASLSSIRFKVGGKEWKNNLKMTMPGRFVIQKFLRQAVAAGCRYAVLEVTSEGIRQFRHAFINFDTAVFTNLSPEHLESHGSFENYRNEKLKLFLAAKHIHVVNADDENASYFSSTPARETITFGLQNSRVTVAAKLTAPGQFEIGETRIALKLLGDFNVYNATAAIAAVSHYGVPLETCKKALEKAEGVPGRMEVVSRDPFVVVDYAHTPEQLEKAYQTFQNPPRTGGQAKLVCVLGSCGGGRDKWKRPVLGKLAKQYCRQVIVTNEDPYDEDAMAIINEVAAGAGDGALKVPDRKEAICQAIALAGKNDAVIITGKGSESLMCLADGKKIPWDDRQVARDCLSNKQK